MMGALPPAGATTIELRPSGGWEAAWPCSLLPVSNCRTSSAPLLVCQTAVGRQGLQGTYRLAELGPFNSCPAGRRARTRTWDPLLRRQMLYPTELRARDTLYRRARSNRPLCKGVRRVKFWRRVACGAVRRIALGLPFGQYHRLTGSGPAMPATLIDPAIEARSQGLLAQVARLGDLRPAGAPRLLQGMRQPQLRMRLAFRHSAIW